MGKLTILGAGGTGLALAAAMSLEGHDVFLGESPAHAAALEAVTAGGGIALRRCEQQLHAPPPRLGTDMAEALKDADCVIFACTAQRQEEFISLCLPHAGEEQVWLFAPGNGGSLECRRMWSGQDGGPLPLLAEMEGNFFPCRQTGPAASFQALEAAPRYVAALPARRNAELCRRLSPYFEVLPATDVLEASLNSPNVTIHLAASLLNLGNIERMGAEFRLFQHGLSPAVLLAVEALHQEKEKVFARCGYQARSPLPLLRALMEEELSPGLERFASLAGPDGPGHRYFTEDAYAGVCLLHSLGRLHRLAMPVTGAALTLTGAIHKQDYIRGGRTLKKLAPGCRNGDELRAFLDH